MEPDTILVDFVPSGSVDQGYITLTVTPWNCPEESHAVLFTLQTYDPEGVEAQVPGTPLLSLSAYPNPFNPETTIDYALQRTTAVSLVLYGLDGKPVSRILENRVQGPGLHSCTLNAAQLSSGVYWLDLQAGGEHLRRKLTLIK